MNVSTNAKMILSATRDLANRWNSTKDQWHDVKSAGFEEEYLTGVFVEAERAAQTLEELNRIILSVRSQCE
jgi:hypothetical protein